MIVADNAQHVEHEDAGGAIWTDPNGQPLGFDAERLADFTVYEPKPMDPEGRARGLRWIAAIRLDRAIP